MDKRQWFSTPSAGSLVFPNSILTFVWRVCLAAVDMSANVHVCASARVYV
jgi:hypothetical protein